MNILIISFHDDNFGDNLIKICFKNLLKVVLNNLKIKKYVLNEMPLKSIDKSLIENSDMIFFAGGGLFGLSYLDFFDYLDEIIKIADNKNIPVIFSSIGINNMSATNSKETRLKKLLEKKCIKAISVRENIELFKSYTQDTKLKVFQVCDPGVWSKYVYNVKKNKNSDYVGINVVRGGLFQDNNKNWKLKDEMNYLNNLKVLLDKNNINYKFYTNGSILDNNSLKFYAKNNKISNDLLFMPHTTRELVEGICNFNFIVSFRMHSSIIAYSLEIPSVNIIWNDKIPLFYENINRKELALPLENLDEHKILDYILNIKGEKVNTDYLMTLYDYLFNTLSKMLKIKNEKYVFDDVVKYLKKLSVGVDEDLLDYKIKAEKAQNLYLARFSEVKKLEKNYKEEIRINNELKEEIKKLKSENDLLLKSNYHLKDIVESQKKDLQNYTSDKIVNFIKKSE